MPMQILSGDTGIKPAVTDPVLAEQHADIMIRVLTRIAPNSVWRRKVILDLLMRSDSNPIDFTMHGPLVESNEFTRWYINALRQQPLNIEPGYLRLNWERFNGETMTYSTETMTCFTEEAEQQYDVPSKLPKHRNRNLPAPSPKKKIVLSPLMNKMIKTLQPPEPEPCMPQMLRY